MAIEVECVVQRMKILTKTDTILGVDIEVECRVKRMKTLTKTNMILGVMKGRYIGGVSS